MNTSITTVLALKPRQHQEERENGTGPKSCLREQNVTRLNERDNDNEMGVLYREMEDWYREEGNRSTVGSIVEV